MKKTTSQAAFDALDRLKEATAGAIYALINQPGTNDHVDSTISRALRRMRSRGIVVSRRVGRYVLWSKPAPKPQVSVKVYGSPILLKKVRMNTPTLTKAVEDTVKSFVTLGKSFSAFDITKEVRDMVNRGNLSVDPLETGEVYLVGEGAKPDIKHELVRQIVHDMFHNGSMSEYERVHMNGYWTYNKKIEDDEDTLVDYYPLGMSDYSGDPSL